MSILDLGLPKDRTVVMGILNVTPDSFADGGKYLDTSAAINRGIEMLEEGVDIIDVGGESTRPNSVRVSEEEEAKRVIPVIKELSRQGALLSIDTTRSNIARSSVMSGARIVNDISAGTYDENMLKTVAELNCPYIAMHTRGNSSTMTSLAIYQDVVSEVIHELSLRVEAILEAGISRSNVVLDPGIGFAKEPEHNWVILAKLDSLESLGYPVLVGASRKRFLGVLTGTTSPAERDSASIALTTLLARRHTWGVRVHSVKPNLDAILVASRF